MFLVRTTDDVPPAGLLPLHLSSNMFRKHVRQGTSRCQVPHGVYRVLEEVTQALTQGQKLLMVLKEELTNILGNVGTNLEMQTLLQSSATCWDWARLVSHLPTGTQVQAFIAILYQLRPFLEHTRWPLRIDFPRSRGHGISAISSLASNICCSCKRCVAWGARLWNPKPP